MRQQAADGNLVLAYVDEAGFSAVHPNRSAWTPKGERHLMRAPDEGGAQTSLLNPP